LSLEFLGQNLKISAIDIAPVELPTLFLAGDSTVADHMGEPYAAWGQMLPRFLKPVVAVANHAHPGASMESFEAAGRLSKIMSLIKPRDYLLIQFGHNDQKAHLPTYAAAKTLYRDLLRIWIRQAREKGAVPILVTPPERGFFDSKGHLKRTLDDYAEAVRMVAGAEKVPLVDLNAASVALYESLGQEKVRFIFAKHGEDGDFTHNNNYGAWILARSVVEGLRDTPLSGAILDDLAPFDPARPPSREEFILPASPLEQKEKPAGS
jgi:lysophospholipase L1-like esterase